MLVWGGRLANRKCRFTRYCKCLDSLHFLGSKEKPIIDLVEPTCTEAPMSTMLSLSLGFRIYGLGYETLHALAHDTYSQYDAVISGGKSTTVAGEPGFQGRGIHCLRMGPFVSWQSQIAFSVR